MGKGIQGSFKHTGLQIHILMHPSLSYTSLSWPSSGMPNFVEMGVYKVLWIYLLFGVILEVDSYYIPAAF